MSEDTSDVIIRTDLDGFICNASPGIEKLGIELHGQLIGPHLLDLVDRTHADRVKDQHRRAICGATDCNWIEFLVVTGEQHRQWFAIQTRSLRGAEGEIYGALSVLRCIHERKLLEERLFAAELTDSLTGLTNRQAFMTMLGHMIEDRKQGCVALFEIDHFRAINLRYGQAAGDDVLVVFARLVREATGCQDTISRVGSHTLGVLFPGARIHQAEAVCRNIIATLSEIRDSRHSLDLTITASAGLSRNVGTVDETIRSAELAKLLAKAKGRNRLELAGHSGSLKDTTKTTNPCVNLHPGCWNEPGQLQSQYCAA